MVQMARPKPDWEMAHKWLKWLIAYPTIDDLGYPLFV